MTKNRPKTILFLLLGFGLTTITACSATAYLVDKKAAEESKKRAYTNNSEVNTSFTLTMGEREFILGEREETKQNNDAAIMHYKKAKDLYDQAYISSYLFQRNWTLENYQRILQIKDMRIKINRLFRGAYEELSRQVSGGETNNVAKKNFEALEELKKKILPDLKESDSLLNNALELSLKYDMFQTKYVSVDAMKKLNKVLLETEELVNFLLPDNKFADDGM